MKFNYNCLAFHFFLPQLFIISYQLYFLKLIEKTKRFLKKFNDDLYDVLVASKAAGLFCSFSIQWRERVSESICFPGQRCYH